MQKEAGTSSSSTSYGLSSSTIAGKVGVSDSVSKNVGSQLFVGPLISPTNSNFVDFGKYYINNAKPSNFINSQGTGNVTPETIINNLGLGIKNTGVSNWESLKSLATVEGWENIDIMFTPLYRCSDEELVKKVQMIQNISDSITSGYNEFVSGDWNVKSYYISRVGSEIVLSLVVAKGTQYATKAIKLGNLNEIVGVSGKLDDAIERTVKTIPIKDYTEIYESSVHNGYSNNVMLGKYDGGGATSYIKKAKDFGYSYFDLGEDWGTIKAKYNLTDDEMFKLFNESFLDDGINANKSFAFSHNPVGDTGALGAEYSYLKNNGYIYNPGTMTMTPKK